jgi:hypothetical protein
MSLEVELYMSNVIKFFNENPKDLMNFVTQDKKDEFFQKIKEKALENVEKGEEVVLTQQQFIDICVNMNEKQVKEFQYLKKIMVTTQYGQICWN